MKQLLPADMVRNEGMPITSGGTDDESALFDTSRVCKLCKPLSCAGSGPTKLRFAIKSVFRPRCDEFPRPVGIDPEKGLELRRRYSRAGDIVLGRVPVSWLLFSVKYVSC